MASQRRIPDETPDPHSSRRAELSAFIVLAVLIWPIIAVGFVGAYGFAVWVWQMAFGPPGPPG
jgi:periplasmic nitrate reductase NapE